MRARVLALTLLATMLAATLAPAAEAAAITTESTKLTAPVVGASAAYVDGRTYLLGGRFASGTYSAQVLGFDPATRALQTVTELPVTDDGGVLGSRGRYSGTAVAYAGKVYYFGGAQLMEQDINGDGTKEQVPKASRDVIEFDPATRTARMLNDKLPLGAWGMTSVVANGRIYLFGGFTFDITDVPSTGRHDRILRFDPARPEPVEGSAARFEELPSRLMYPVQDAAAALLGRRVVIMGGLSDHDNDTNPCPTYTYEGETRQITVCLTKRIMTFDPDTETVIGVAGELPYRAQFISAAAVGGKAYVAGGLLSDSSASTSILEVTLDRAGTPTTRVLVPSLPRGTFGQAVTTDGQTILLAGGRFGGERDLTDEILRLDPRPTPPWAPRGATAVDIAGGVRLTWEPPTYDGDAPVSGYRVYRSANGGEEERLAETRSLSYDDTTLRPGVEYVWRVTAVNAAGESVQAGRITRASGIAAPGAVSSFEAYPGDNKAVLRWNPPTENGGANLTGYRILRNDDIIASVGPATFEYLDETVTNGETYTYRVRASNVKGDGALSPARVVTPAAVPPPPGDVRAAEDGAAVRVTWLPVDASESYSVYRSARAFVKGTLLGNVTGDTSYTDRTVERGQTYFYSVVASNSEGESQPSTQSAVSLVNVPGAPTQVVAIAQPGHVRISWEAPEDTGDAPPELLRYYVSRASSGSGPRIIATDLEHRLFIDRTVSPNLTYTYTVTTLNPKESEPSAAVTARAIAAENRPPRAELAALPPIANAGDPIQLDASNSGDEDGAIVSYLYDFGDGTDPMSTREASVSHQYFENGTYNATVTVTDNRGATSRASAQVIVGEIIDETLGDRDSLVPTRPTSPSERPGSGTPEIPAPGAPLLALALAGAALLAARRRGR